MKLKNARRWSQVPRPRAYAYALVLTFLVWVVRMALHPYVHGYLPFQLFVIDCMLIQFTVGLGPALMSTALSLYLGLYFFVEPYGKWGPISRGDLIVSCNFVLVCLVSIFLIENLRRSLYAAQLWAKIAESRYVTSMRRENERLHAAKQVHAKKEASNPRHDADVTTASEAGSPS